MADRTSTHDVAKVGGRSEDDAELAMGSMTDLKAPQPGYIDMIQKGGYVEMGEGFGLSFDRATSDHVLRNHQLFSSRVEMSLGNVRPLIPLNVDPPLHSQIPQAPRPTLRSPQDGGAGGGHHPTGQRVHRLVHRSQGVQLQRGVRRAAARRRCSSD